MTTAAVARGDSVRMPNSFSPTSAAGVEVTVVDGTGSVCVSSTEDTDVAVVVRLVVGDGAVRAARSAASRAGEPSGAVVEVAVTEGWLLVSVVDVVDRSAASLAGEPSGAFEPAATACSLARSAPEARAKPAADAKRSPASAIRSGLR